MGRWEPGKRGEEGETQDGDAKVRRGALSPACSRPGPQEPRSAPAATTLSLSRASLLSLEAQRAGTRLPRPPRGWGAPGCVQFPDPLTYTPRAGWGRPSSPFRPTFLGGARQRRPPGPEPRGWTELGRGPRARSRAAWPGPGRAHRWLRPRIPLRLSRKCRERAASHQSHPVGWRRRARFSGCACRGPGKAAGLGLGKPAGE